MIARRLCDVAEHHALRGSPQSRSRIQHQRSVILGIEQPKPVNWRALFLHLTPSLHLARPNAGTNNPP
jgi:hypothetical protein